MPGDSTPKGTGPRVLLLQPPVYDFALYDLYLKPAGLLGVGYQFASSGYDVSFVNALDYSDPLSADILGKPSRKSNGTGKFFRAAARKPEALKSAGRGYARYGLLQEVFEARIGGAFDRATPDLVLMGTGMTYWYPGVREAVRSVRDIYPGVPVIAGGVYATLLSDHCRRECEPDFVVPGPVYPGINSILSGLGLPCLEEPERGFRVLMERDTWADAGVLFLNRGCPFSCAYCASGLVSGPFAPGDPDVLFQTAETMFHSFGTRNFAFYDDALLVRKEDVLFPFLDRIAGAGYPFFFYLPNAMHISLTDMETASRLHAGGFRDIRLGFESASTEFHDRMDGKVTRTAFDEALAALGRAGFSPGQITVYILAGLPEQRAAEVRESAAFVAERGVRISLSEYSPVPGSELWEKSVGLAEVDLAGEPLFQNNTFFPLEWSEFTREDLEDLKKGVREHNAHIPAVRS